MRKGKSPLFSLLGLAVLWLSACRGIETDILYARRLPGPPVETDWAAAVPLRALVSGGSVHQDLKPVSAQEVDRDTIHRNSASCHHGPSRKAFIPVWLRAYYDEKNIYLRLTWPDLTRDIKGRDWIYRDGAWRVEGGGGDGIALIFPKDGSPYFSCALVCHLDDYAVSGGRFQESARMHYAADGSADMWLWRADQKETLDLFIDREGIRRVADGVALRIKNSRLTAEGKTFNPKDYLFFDPYDEPMADAAGRRLPDGFRPSEGKRLPAYLPLPKAPRGSIIKTGERYRNGTWEITLVRTLSTGNPRDVVFSSGGVYFFGLSVLDDTLRNHHIIESSLKMELIS